MSPPPLQPTRVVTRAAHCSAYRTIALLLHFPRTAAGDCRVTRCVAFGVALQFTRHVETERYREQLRVGTLFPAGAAFHLQISDFKLQMIDGARAVLPLLAGGRRPSQGS